MAKFTSPLDNVRVASPCPANWDDMNGNEKMRFCSQCQLNVYNLSGMTRREAEELITNAEGRLCVRYYKRADGSIITQNCPVGLQALKRRVSRAATAFFSAVIGFLGGLGFVTAYNYGTSSDNERAMGIVAERPVVETPVEKDPEAIMGDMPLPNKIPEEVVGKTVPQKNSTQNKRSHR